MTNTKKRTQKFCALSVQGPLVLPKKSNVAIISWCSDTSEKQHHGALIVLNNVFVL